MNDFVNTITYLNPEQPHTSDNDTSTHKLEKSKVALMLNNLSNQETAAATSRDKSESISDVATVDLGEASASKKKTPMCLINELARHHKLQPQYRLIDDSGPAHQKTFTVCLKLDTEEYIAAAQSIKKAQHAAAQKALENTSFQLPEPKPKLKNLFSSNETKLITPTVELNALAMKFNLMPVYSNLPSITPAITSPEQIGFGTSYPKTAARQDDFRSNLNVPHSQYLNADFQARARQPQLMNQRTFYNRRFFTNSKIHRVSLSIGEISVTGEGPSPQSARHDAAQKALIQLNEILPTIIQAEVPVIGDIEFDSGLKSPVSLAHELALKINQTIDFTLVNESGPPHMRTFVVQCTLGNLTAQGEGNCKKLAKKKAAESIIEEWRKAYPKNLSISQNESIACGRSRQKMKSSFSRKKPRNLVKETNPTSNSCVNSKSQDPISQLVQLQQAKKEKEPVFTLISEKGLRRQPEFVVQVTVGSVTEFGKGLKKKDAKRAAALKALETIEASQESQPEPNREIDSESVHREKNPTKAQVPGILVIGSPQEKKENGTVIITSPSSNGIREQPVVNHTTKTSGSLRPEIRLRYLAQVLEYEVEFSDFPKGRKGEYVSLVTLNTDPPQVSHGLGSTLEEAHDNAASNMLQLIADGALDSDDVNKESTTERVKDRN